MKPTAELTAISGETSRDFKTLERKYGKMNTSGTAL